MTRPSSEDRYLKAFGRRVAEIREARGFSQEKLATLAGVSRETIGLIERGQRWVRLSTLHRIAKGLGVETFEVLKGLRQ